MKINMQLIDTDERLLHIENVINTKRKMLLDKQYTLQKIVNQNQYLDGVKEDYAKYYQYISQQKRDQIKSLELLNTYINDLSSSGELSKYNINDAKFEQSKILKEVTLIKKGLDSLITNTSNF
jgi:hypothetical protein